MLVTLESDDSQVFSGIQISAHRKSLNKEEFQGTFLSYAPETKLQAYNCMGGRHVSTDPHKVLIV